MLVLSVLTVYAETEKGAQITGKVIDASTKQGMEFANISLRKTGSKEFIKGTVSDQLRIGQNGLNNLLREYIWFKNNQENTIAII